MALEQYRVKSLDKVNKWHLERYMWSRQFVKNKIVLDAACGCGYGSSILAKEAKEVHGYDRDKKVISIANEHWARPNVWYRVFDLVDNVIDEKFNVIVSLETLEHLPMPIEETISMFKNALDSKGILCVSHPVGEKEHRNQFHLHFKIKTNFVLGIMRKMGFNILFDTEQVRDKKHRYRYIVGELI